MNVQPQVTGKLELTRAWRAFVALTRNPDDTAQVFTLIESLSGGTPQRLHRRLLADPNGPRLLRERPDIVPLLANRARLRQLPEGSLGRAYLAFVESEGISADGLRAASAAGEEGGRLSSELSWLHDRMRDTHDLWHTLTGYRGDVLGEVALLAFNLPQTHNPALALIVLFGLTRARTREAFGLILGGLRRGLRSRWLPALDWEALLARPVAELRRELGVGEPPAYTPVRSSELRALGLIN